MEKAHEMSVDHSEVMSALVNINEKQDHLILSKKVLEEKIKEVHMPLFSSKTIFKNSRIVLRKSSKINKK